MEHEDRRHLRARVGCRRDFRRRHRLCHVHASACRPCRLEHAARQWPLGADFSEGALRVRQDRVRLLDRDARENAGAAVCRQRAAGRRGQTGRNRPQRLPDRRPHPHPADARPHARPCRLHLRPRQGRRRVLGRPDAFAAADALSGNVRQVRRRSGAGGDDAAQFHGALLRYAIRCAAPRISPPRRSERSGARAADFPARRYEFGHACIRDAFGRAGRRACDDRQAQSAGRIQRAQHPDGARPRALFRGRGAGSRRACAASS